MTLKYLVTILYRPRATMRRILQSQHRWTLQVAALAAVCASVNDADAARLGEALPQLKLMPVIAIVAVTIVATALAWIAILFVLSWIATPIGRRLGGTGTAADVRAAMAWSLVPTVWSPIYRIPFTMLASYFRVSPRTNAHETIINFLSHGGCSLIVVYLFVQFLFEIATVVLASFTVGEAQRFSTQKGFVNVAITLALPVVVVLAAVFSSRS